MGGMDRAALSTAPRTRRAPSHPVRARLGVPYGTASNAQGRRHRKQAGIRWEWPNTGGLGVTGLDCRRHQRTGGADRWKSPSNPCFWWSFGPWTGKTGIDDSPASQTCQMPHPMSGESSISHSNRYRRTVSTREAGRSQAPYTVRISQRVP